ncbi:MAG: hypothetical protein EPN47_10240 [Acidobacteria bacterium]|nr:MAG: hypothetical protein EPN47_10240 [Acidobacteriota bacterium]
MTKQLNAKTVPPLTYNQFGVALGGPVPGLKQKTFFFFSTQLTRNRAANTLFGTVPTAAEWNGDLSGYPAQIYNPFDVANGQRTPFANNQIPSSLLSSFAQKYKQYVPLPDISNAPYGHDNLVINGRQLNDDSQWLIRVDQDLPRDGRLFVKYFRDRVNSISYGLSQFAGIAQPLKGQSASVRSGLPWDGRRARNGVSIKSSFSASFWMTLRGCWNGWNGTSPVVPRCSHALEVGLPAGAWHYEARNWSGVGAHECGGWQ